MRKLLVLLCMGLLTASLAACGKKDKDNGGNSQGTELGSVETETQTVENSGGNDAADNTENNGGTDAGAEGSGTWSKEMSAIRQAVVDALGENYWPTEAMTPEMLEGSFGITSDMYQDYLAEVPMISVNVDTLLIIKAKSDKVDEVEEALNAYRDSLVNDTMQYPMNLGKIQASRIEKIGDYVCFVQLGADTQAAAGDDEEAVIAYCQEQNELVIEIISKNIER